MRRRFSLSVRSLLALPLALQALAGSVMIAMLAQHSFTVATREAIETSLSIKAQLIHRLLRRELALLNQQAVVLAEAVPFVAAAESFGPYLQQQREVFGLDAVLVSRPNQPPIAIGTPIPAGREAWLWTDTEVIARAVLPTGTVVSTALSRARLHQTLHSGLSEHLCIEIQTVPPSAPLVLGDDCLIGAVGLSQAGSEWQYVQNFAADWGLSWQISLRAPTQHYQDWRPTLAIVGFNIGIAVLLGLLLSHQLTRPLDRLASNAKAISDGDTQTTLAPEGIKEIDALAGALLTLTQRLRLNLEDLSKSRAQLSQVLADLPVGVAIHDREGTVTYFNTAGRQILGLEAIPQGPLPDLAKLFQAYRVGTDELYPPEEMPVGYALKGQPMIKDDMEIRLHGQQLQLRISGVPLMDETGELRGAVTVFEDVTAVKLTARLQADYLAGLDQQFQDIQRLNTLKEDFLSTVSHELRTPIANMRMAMQMLQIALYDINLAEGLRQRVQRYFQILQQECQRETQLIEDLLSLTLSTAERPTQNDQDLNIPAWLQTVTQPYYARLEAQHQRLSIQLLTVIPTVRTDPTILERAVGELVNNACKYTPQGGQIIIALRADAQSLFLTLSNTGVSISDRDLPYIFDKFYRVPGHNPWAQGGTGLGLALVKQLIEHLGGSITVKSSPQQVDFTITLPLARTAPPLPTG